MRRFFVNELLPLDLELNHETNITGGDARHISKVLRLAVGDEIIISFKDWDEQAAKAVITKANAACVTVRLKEIFTVKTEPPIKVWLAQGVPKSDKMDFIVQKAVELGVMGVIPVTTQYCVAKYPGAKEKSRLDRWQKISREAAKQCGRSHIPTIMPFTSLTDLFKNKLQPPLEEWANMKILLLYEGLTALTLKMALTGHCSKVSSYLLIIGPEGGFSLEEIKLCQGQGAEVVSAGPRILRTETAALAAIGALMYQYGDLGG